MSSDWPLVRLGDHVDSCLGKMLDAKKNKGMPQQYLGNSNVRWGTFDLVDLAEMKFELHEEERYSLHPSDLVVCEGGEPGRCAIWTGSPGMKIQKALHRIRPKDTLDNYYLFYWFCLAAKTGTLEPYFTGTTIKHLTGKAITALEVPLPPVSIQRSIVDILKSLDDRITLLRETNATLEAIAQALFKSWFVDFDPVRAKMQGRAPEGIDEDTVALFPDAFEESELGAVPRGWRTAEFGEILELTKGCSYKGDGLSEFNGAYMFNLGCFNAHRIFATQKVKRYTGDYKPHHEVVAGDLIIANTDMTQSREILGRPVFVPDGMTPGFISHHVFRVKVKVGETRQAEALRAFIFFALQQNSFRERAIGFATGTTVLALPAAAVLGSPICLPTEQTLEKFSDVVRPIFQKIRENEKQADLFSDARDTLLPRLISGQLRLPEAQAELEAVDAV